MFRTGVGSASIPTGSVECAKQVCEECNQWHLRAVAIREIEAKAGCQQAPGHVLCTSAFANTQPSATETYRESEQEEVPAAKSIHCVDSGYRKNEGDKPRSERSQQRVGNRVTGLSKDRR